ncbi:MAG: hypothetical protein DWP97_04420, partial [Calditrichaeota bacterium]
MFFKSNLQNRVSGSFSGLMILTVLLMLSIFIGCSNEDSSSNGGPSGSSDNTAPAVSSSTPASSSTGVSTGAVIQITFSEDIDPLSVTTSSVFITGVTSTVSVSSNVISVTPSSQLSSATEYTVIVTTAVKDLSGNALPSEHSFKFTTGTLPVAMAGNDQEVSYGDVVTLDGTQSSDGGGASLSYIWTQKSGPSVGGLTGANPQFVAPDAVTSLTFELVVSNGSESSTPDEVVVSILEDAQHAYYVSPSGDNGNSGTKASPFATIQYAIDYSNTEGAGADIYIAAGTYNESITLRTDVSLYGGFDAATWERNFTAHQSVIMGGNYAVYGNGTSLLTIDGMYIQSADANFSGGSSVGIALSSAQGITITNNSIAAGAGYTGYNGTTYSKPNKTNNGSGGADSYFNLISCSTGGGGSGGSSSIGRKGGNGGGQGGASGGSAGKDGTGGDGISGGGGGDDGSFASNGHGGDNGDPGTEGGNGNGGIEFGTISNGYYYVSSGNNGSRGKHGGGGGGGGGGGAGASCCAAGGGGGAGGVGGPGGSAGGGGGASIGILMDAGVFATIKNNNITTSNGGDGGVGGNGAE